MVGSDLILGVYADSGALEEVLKTTSLQKPCAESRDKSEGRCRVSNLIRLLT
jgi:hypothetical protein